MLREYIAEGNTVDDAISRGCNELELDSFDVTTEILELPKKGFFGKIKSKAKVKIIYDDGVAEPEKKPAPKKAPQKQPVQKTEEKKPETKAVKEPQINSKPDEVKEHRDNTPGDKDKKIQIAKEYIKNILTAMGIEQVEFEIQENEDGVIITLVGDNLGVIIGRRGETLDAIQYLVSLVCNRIDSGYYRITIDCGEFRKKREQTLIELAEKIANTVIKTGRNTTLEPMNPYERRIIHAVISEKEGVFSRSVGEEPYRKVVISSPNAKSSYRPRGGRNERNDRGDRRPNQNRRPRDNKPKTDVKPQENREKLNDVTGDSLYSKIEL